MSKIENTNCSSKIKDNYCPQYLWVYEPDDIKSLSIEEIEVVWMHRKELCGSLESAAEALAILNKYNGKDKEYRGWKYYLNTKEIQELHSSIMSLNELENLNISI